jgi:hypothetical protein
MPAELHLCGFTLTEEEWLELDDETRELIGRDADADALPFPYDSYEVVLEPIPGLA